MSDGTSVGGVRTGVGAHAPLARGAASRATLVGAPALGDMASVLAQIQIDRRSEAAGAAKGSYSSAEARRDEQVREARAAEEQAKEAEEHSSFWGKVAGTFGRVAEAAAVVAAVASVVATGGASAPAILALSGTVLSASSPLVAKATGDETLGKAALFGGIALSVGGGGVAMMSASGSGSGFAKLVAASAHVAEGSARIGQGASTIEQKKFAGDVVDDQADVLAARVKQRERQAELDDVVAKLKDAEESVTRAMATIMSTQEDVHATRRTLIAHVGRSLGA